MNKIALFLFCFSLWCTVHAQWTFTVDYTSHCSGWDDLRATLEGEHIKSEYNNKQYPSRNACETARNSIHSPMSCLVIHCTPCTGHGGEDGNVTVSTDPNVNPSLLGPNYGTSVTPTNKADEVKQWMKDYYKQNGLAFDEDFFDEWYANNIYFRKEMDELFAQKHAQMMEMNDRENEINTREDNLRIKKNGRNPNYVDKVRLYQKQLSDATMTKYGRTITGEHGVWNDVVTDGKDGLLDALDVCISTEAEVRFGPVVSLATTPLSTVSFGKSFSDELKELIEDVQWATMSSRDVIEMNKKINEVYAKHIGIMLSKLPGGMVLRYLWNQEVNNKTNE